VDVVGYSKNEYEILMKKLRRKRQLGRPRKCEIGCGGGDETASAL
jgi:hypothetical protein